MQTQKTYRYIASQADFRSARRLLFKNTRSAQLTPLFMAIVVFFALPDWLDGSPSGLTLLIGTVVWGWQFLRQYCLLPARWSARSEAFIGNEWTVAYSSEGMQFTSPDLDSTMRWTNITKVIENSTIYYLGGKAGRFYVVPKRVFESTEDEDVFRSTLRRNIPDALT